MMTSSSTRPRSMQVISGVSRSHMLVSQTSIRSAFNSLAFSAMKAGREVEPDSSSPSNRMVTLQGRPPLARKARQASTKVMSWPLSSAAPRADDLLARRRLGHMRREGIGSARAPADRPAARRNGRKTAHAAHRAAPPWPWRPPSDGRRSAAKRPRSPAPATARPASRRRRRNRAHKAGSVEMDLKRRSSNRRSSAPWRSSSRLASTLSRLGMLAPA